MLLLGYASGAREGHTERDRETLDERRNVIVSACAEYLSRLTRAVHATLSALSLHMEDLPRTWPPIIRDTITVCSLPRWGPP